MAVAILVATSFVPAINDTVATITTPTYSVGVAGIWGIMLLIFGAAVIIKFTSEF